MALIRCDFFSDVLGVNTSMTVILPQSTSTRIGLTGHVGQGEPPVLYLLHGRSDDDTAWLRNTSIERYVAPLGLAVVMPQVQLSFYADEAHGNRFWTFLSEELPGVVRDFFRVSTRRQDTFVAGLSMGGYGAFKWALRDPGRFAAAASMSGALDIEFIQRTRSEVLVNVFDGPAAGTKDDLLTLLGPDTPPLYVACGTEDHLFTPNETFVAAARAAGTPLTVDFSPGAHEWSYWDAKIQDVLAWLPLPA